MKEMKKLWNNLKKYIFSEGTYEIQAIERSSKHVIDSKDLLSIFSWNIGYCSLGKDANWVFEGGKRMVIATKDEMMENLNGILKTLKKQKIDFLFLQEVPKRSIITYYTNPLGRILHILKKYNCYFSPKLYIKSLIAPTNIGSAIITKYKSETTDMWKMPPENLHIFRKNLHHNFVVTHFSIKNSLKKLILINIHLPAFDKKGIIREQHLKKIMKKITDFYKEGHYVICGGDWNYMLNGHPFDHSSHPRHTKHILPFPPNFIPKKWILSFDSNAATMRTIDYAYEKGKNFTAVIDGFLVSPNIQIKKTKTHPFKFQFSDHNPVSMTFLLE